jgi:Na+-driven multidrug efflux pump
MKNLLALAAAGEAATGLVLLVYPPIVVKLLFGAEIAGAGVVLSRIAGISLIALGLACWPGRVAARAPLCGMLTYSSLATLYLFYLGLGGDWSGKLLWPAIAVHAVLTIFLAWAWFNERKTTEAKTRERGKK